jgi:TetR/AcrR family transcriptional regulator, transcriptional repressor of bet genes
VPKVIDHDWRRAELVDATWRVIAEEGVEAATVRRIAEAANCTTGRVTHYFASKGEVLRAALRQAHGATVERMLAHLGGDDPVEVLRSVVLEALPLDHTRRTEWQVRLAFFGLLAADPALGAEQERRYDEWRAFLDGLVWRAAPALGDDRRGASVDVLVAAVDGLAAQAALEPHRFPRERLRDAVDRLIEATLA